MSQTRTRSRASTRSATRRKGLRAATALARTGLVARTVFYVTLVLLVIQLMLTRGNGRQANAHGALSVIAEHPGGMVAIAVTAIGFLALGGVRIWGAIRDSRVQLWQRIRTFLQGAFYLVLSWLPVSYALGKRTSGSEQQHQRGVEDILSLPGGQVVLFIVGLVIVGVCVVQMRNGIDQRYADGMKTRGSPRWVPPLVRVSGTVGITARAAVFLPIGVLSMVAAVRSNASRADGLDAELAGLARRTWGLAVLALIALGLAVFAIYSGLEARYREVARGR